MGNTYVTLIGIVTYPVLLLATFGHICPRISVVPRSTLMNSVRQAVAVLIFALLLAACGGGGGGSNDPKPPPLVEQGLVWDQASWNEREWQ